MLLRTLTSLAGFPLAALALASWAVAAESPGKPLLKVGIIGLDTSHCVAFTMAIQGPKPNPQLASLKVVAAFPGGSPDIPASADRVAGFTDKIKSLGVEIVDSIAALLSKVDVVLIEAVDGRPHLEQARQVIAAGKPMFIDKPLAGSLADGVEIYRLARAAGVPCFSSSALRFSPGIAEMRSRPEYGDVLGCSTYSPCSLDAHHPDLFWYGIHGVETLYTIMGPGCKTVTRVHTADTDLVVGVWADGRIGTFRGLRSGKTGFGGTVFGTKGLGPIGSFAGYEPLLVEIARFFETGKPPVSPEETLEILAFMEAADESKRQNGAAVSIESVMKQAGRK